MWHDNDTDIDLLGFDVFVDTISHLVKKTRLLPLTMGVYGDWGSGKSSLMRMARGDLETSDRYVCVSFSPWQYEDYEDTKAALLALVLSAVRKQISVGSKVAEEVTDKTESLLRTLGRRVNWIRLLGFAGKGLTSVALAAHGQNVDPSMAISAMSDLVAVPSLEHIGEAMTATSETGDKVLREPREEVRETIEQSIGEFREDFGELLARVDIDALVVFIDDLDRCLPDTIVDVLEAVRLFLAVPKTAYVIGADERIIQHAVARRYPELPGQAIDISRDYLEKIVQIPMRIPRMTAAEIETYLNLLMCELDLPEADFLQLATLAGENRRKGNLDVALNLGIARGHLNEVPAALVEHMQLFARISPTLCGGLKGNPRQTKCFMNTLLLRRELASARKIALDEAILAKLMILEYFHETRFQQLFEWQAQSHGIALPLRPIEGLAQSGETVNLDLLSQEQREWLSDDRLYSWLSLTPPVSDVNLSPYFYFSRDRIGVAYEPALRLSQTLQEILHKLIGESDAGRELGRREAENLSNEDFRNIFDALIAQFRSNPGMTDGKFAIALITLVGSRREVVTTFIETLKGIPTGSLPPGLAMAIVRVFGASEPLSMEFQKLLKLWSQEQPPNNFSKAASRALTRVNKP
jgi:KAP family P-loop domain